MNHVFDWFYKQNGLCSWSVLTAHENIVVSDSRRDADLNDEDSFLFIFDAYNDQQNGFLLDNADAMQFDAQIDNEGEETLAIIVNKEALLAEPILTGTLLGKLKRKET